MSAIRDRTTPAEVLPTSEARKTLSQTTRRFAKKGAKAKPVFFGTHRKPEGVMLSYESYLGLLDALDDLMIALTVKMRDRADTGERLNADDLARKYGFDPDQIRRERDERNAAEE